MGIDIRKELARLQGMEKNWTQASLSERDASEYNSILGKVQEKGVDVAIFRLTSSDFTQSAYQNPLEPEDTEYGEPYVSGNQFRAKLDGLLAFLGAEGEEDGAVAGDAMAVLSSIGEHFSDYVRPLTNRRRSGKKPFEIVDEYDVQDLIHAALSLHFEDVRPEEPMPSFANKGSLIDFFLPEEGVGIEVKFVRNKGHGKEVATEINDDVPRYGEHPDLVSLIAYIYDPHHYIGNSAGVIKQLETLKIKGNPISVYICN